MTIQEISAINEEATRRRATLRDEDPEQLMGATLKELLKLPPYIGFVEGRFLSDLPFVMFLCDRDDGVALRLFWKGEFERVSLSIWRRLVLASDLVVDVGGHTGIYSIVAGLTNPKAQVHSFEPHEMNFGRLLLNLRSNGLRPNNAHYLAASAMTGAVPFRVKINHYLSSGGAVAAEGDEFTKMVPAAPIDDHVPLTLRKVCVKIDTEGHEVEVLAGMPKLLDQRPDIILECAFVPEMRDTELQLRARDYRFFHIDEQGWGLNRIESLSFPPSDAVGASRENVLLTTRTDEEVRALFDLARGDYRPA
jgi:FkbM family methyltransferase